MGHHQGQVMLAAIPAQISFFIYTLTTQLMVDMGDQQAGCKSSGNPWRRSRRAIESTR
ncbi:MAG: hypothetical protein ACLSH6_09695 [Limosilactobacillus pontis]